MYIYQRITELHGYVNSNAQLAYSTDALPNTSGAQTCSLELDACCARLVHKPLCVCAMHRDGKKFIACVARQT